MNSSIDGLRQRCRAKHGATEDNLSAEGYNILNGFLTGFAKFYKHLNPPVLLVRCPDSLRKELKRKSRGVRKSKRMCWETVGWSWTDIKLDGTIDQESLLAVIDASYELACDDLYDSQKKQLAVLTRNLTVPELIPEMMRVFGLNRRRSEIEALAQPALLLKTTSMDEARLALGCSKIGGCPDLPQGEAWPLFADGRPLAFLAQINFGEIPVGIRPPAIPKSGIVYFFSVFGWQVEDSSDPQLPTGKYTDAWTKVVFCENDGVDLNRLATPPNVNSFAAAGIDFTEVVAFPTLANEPAVAKFKWTRGVKDKYEEFVDALNGVCGQNLGGPARNLLLGFADYAQGFVKEVAKHDLQLRFQLASDDNARMCWGDGGYIYFWIRTQDLAQRNFSRIHTDYQCG